MNKTAITAIIIFVFTISFAAGMQNLEVAKAWIAAPAIIIYSPAPIIYTKTSLPLNVVVNILNNSQKLFAFSTVLMKTPM